MFIEHLKLAMARWGKTTPRQMADHVNQKEEIVSYDYLRRILKGDRPPPDDAIVLKICQSLGLSETDTAFLLTAAAHDRSNDQQTQKMWDSVRNKIAHEAVIKCPECKTPMIMVGNNGNNVLVCPKSVRIDSGCDFNGTVPVPFASAADMGLEETDEQIRDKQWKSNGKNVATMGIKVRPEDLPRGAIDIKWLPLLGDVPAGDPIKAIEEHNGERIPIPCHVLGGKHERCFCLRVQGESMVDKIMPGDLVVVCKDDEILTGSVVVARFEDDVTLKECRFEGTKMILKPANPAFKTREFNLLDPAHGVDIVGRVTFVMKRM